MIVGHAAARVALEAELPPVVLLQGPASVGKRTLAEYLAKFHGAVALDVTRLERVTADAARELRAFAGTAPVGRVKVAVVRLDGATESALNALLKLFEEPPRTFHAVLTAEVRPLSTIVSRAHLHRVGLLTDEEVFQVLHGRLGMEEGRARKAAARARGQVRAGLDPEDLDQPRALVMSALKAVADGDRDLLERALAGWDEACHSLLQAWVVEAVTGRWRAFSEAESFGLARGPAPMAILRGLRVQARARVTARQALIPLVDRAVGVR